MSQIVIFEPADGGHVTVRLEGDSLWLTQDQIADLFKRERSVITKHLRNIFKEGELVEESNVQILHIAGSDKPVKFYNLLHVFFVQKSYSPKDPLIHALDNFGCVGFAEMGSLLGEPSLYTLLFRQRCGVFRS